MKYAPHGVVFTLHRAGGISPRTLSLQDKRDKFVWFLKSNELRAKSEEFVWFPGFLFGKLTNNVVPDLYISTVDIFFGVFPFGEGDFRRFRKQRSL